MDKKMNLVVKVSISEAVSAVTSTSINTMGVVVTSLTSPIEDAGKYYSSDDVKTDFGATSEAYYMALDFFSQTNHPQGLVIIPVATQTAEVVMEACSSAIETYDVYHFCIQALAASDAATVTALALALETWCLENYKMFHIEVGDPTIASAVQTSLNATSPECTDIWSHNKTSFPTEYLAVAIVASRCGVDPARGTWAHKEVNSITPDAVSVPNFASYKNIGLNFYTKIAGVSRTFFGTCGDKSTFIDVRLKKDWIRFRVMESIFNLLGSANDGYGVSYDDSGIQSIGASVGGIFTKAAANDRQYIMPDYSVTVPNYDDIDAAEKEVRNLPDVKGFFKIMNSIHTVLDIELAITA